MLEDIGDNICGTEYDAARHQWGNKWRLPNSEELGSNNIVVFLTIQYYCLSLRHE